MTLLTMFIDKGKGRAVDLPYVQPVTLGELITYLLGEDIINHVYRQRKRTCCGST